MYKTVLAKNILSIWDIQKHVQPRTKTWADI
jgi:hypothetical protein